MTDDEYAAALRPRRKYAPTLMVLAVCAVVAWLGWCSVLLGRAYRDAVVGPACAEAGHDWAFGDCRAPDIEVKVNIVPPTPPREPAPWGGQTPGAL